MTIYDNNSLSELNIKQFSDFARSRGYRLDITALKKTPILAGKYCGWWCPVVKNTPCPCFTETGYCTAKIFLKMHR